MSNIDPIQRSYCWPVDTSCCEAAWDDYDAAVQDRAIALATSTLRALTGFRVGGCPVTVRPCTTGCSGDGAFYGGSWLKPLNWSGVWTNCGCGGGCVHNGIELPVPVGRVDEVKIDGVVLATTEYRLVDNILLRTDGQRWPTTQNLYAEDTEAGTWSITYLNGYEVDEVGAWVAGLLACQYARACTVGKCDLPASVTSIVRAGVSMTLSPGAFPGGLTGIREIDAFIRQWNPNGLTVPTTVWTPRRTMYQ